MKRSPMELAAIATAAVPGLTPARVAGIPDDPDDFDSALIIDAQKNRWRVRSPRHEESSMRLETELTALRSFTPGIRASLPFRLPSVAGTVRQGSLRTFVYNHLPGQVMDLDELVAAGGSTAADIGRIIAAIHALPEELVDRADLPVYTADEFRQRKLNELDQAAMTGRIPPRLLRRWEHALEDVALWRFNPRVVHGDLHEENLLIEHGKVAAVIGWTDVRIGDPADDFAWLAAAHEQSFTDTVIEAYTAARGELADPHIMRRAALAAEFALAQWLSRGLATNDAERIAEGEQMLRDLDEDISEYGGQPISIVEPPRMDIHGQPVPTDDEAPAATDASEVAEPGHDENLGDHSQTASEERVADAPPHPVVPPKPQVAPVSPGRPTGDEDADDAATADGEASSTTDAMDPEDSDTVPGADPHEAAENEGSAAADDEEPAFLRDSDFDDEQSSGTDGSAAGAEDGSPSGSLASGPETDAMPMIVIESLDEAGPSGESK
ncbi:phosphotransferase [Arthrobacter rhombi]